MQRNTFAGHVRDALAHLFDRSRLRAHPLGRLLLDPDAPAPADALRQLLLDAVEQIRPPEPCPPSSPAWRPYRYTVLRYVEGVKAERVAQELQVSIRQSRREHDRALEQITAVLWERQQPRRARAAPVPATAVDETPGPARGHDGAAEELVRFGALPPTEPVPVAGSLSDALGIVARLAEIEHVEVDVQLPDALRSVWVHRLVLRQVLIDLLSCAVESRPAGQVRIAAAESAGPPAPPAPPPGGGAGGPRVPPPPRPGAPRAPPRPP